MDKYHNSKCLKLSIPRYGRNMPTFRLLTVVRYILVYLCYLLPKECTLILNRQSVEDMSSLCGATLERIKTLQKSMEL
jgi:hypothetical protein